MPHREKHASREEVRSLVSLDKQLERRASFGRPPAPIPYAPIKAPGVPPAIPPVRTQGREPVSQGADPTPEPRPKLPPPARK